MSDLEALFSLRGRVAVVTGATGVLGAAACRALAGAGATVVALARDVGRAGGLAAELVGEAMAVSADVRDRDSLEAACRSVLAARGRVDILVCFAGGNRPGATRDEGASPFDLDLAATREVVDLNLLGTLLPIAAFGPAMVRAEPPPQGGASIVTVASVAAVRALSRVTGYSAAKAGVANLTAGLGAELARRHPGRIRVNALVPGFFVAEQNRAILLDAGGTPTRRGRDVLARTPMGRFGDPAELGGALVWLCGPSAAFVAGATVAVDGGFTADSGV